MKITRTGNAGVLVETNNISILFDGVCKDLFPYSSTPSCIKEKLLKSSPDIVAFTHFHEDHYDSDFAAEYKKNTLRSVYGPELFLQGEYKGVKFSTFSTRHIGKNDIAHVSFTLEGEKCLWFAGDASPLDLEKQDGLPKPDILVIPYAYALTDSAWRKTKAFGAEKIILVHMPEEKNDPYELWKAVREVTQDDKSLVILSVGESIVI